MQVALPPERSASLRAVVGAHYEVAGEAVTEKQLHEAAELDPRKPASDW